MTTETACLQFTSISKDQNYADLFVTFEVDEVKVGSQTIVDRTVTFTWEWVDPNTLANRTASRKFHVTRDEGNSFYKMLRIKYSSRGIAYDQACRLYRIKKQDIERKLAELAQ